jgi:fructuronate reductase
MVRARAGIRIVDPAGDRLAALALAETPARVVEGLIAERLGFPPAIGGDADLVALLKTAAEAAFRGEIPPKVSA